MRKVILNLAVSLDGFIEGANGEFDWCFADQDYGMAAFFERVDAMFIGRKSYELMQEMEEKGETIPGMPMLKEYVFSNSLSEVKKGGMLISGEVEAEVWKIKGEAGKDIWLFGGADLTTSLMNAGLVDELSLAVHPILLGSGRPLFQNIRNRVNFDLIDTQTWSTGLVTLNYRLRGEDGGA